MIFVTKDSPYIITNFSDIKSDYHFMELMVIKIQNTWQLFHLDNIIILLYKVIIIKLYKVFISFCSQSE